MLIRLLESLLRLRVLQDPNGLIGFLEKNQSQNAEHNEHACLLTEGAYTPHPGRPKPRAYWWALQDSNLRLPPCEGGNGAILALSAPLPSSTVSRVNMRSRHHLRIESEVTQGEARNRGTRHALQPRRNPDAQGLQDRENSRGLQRTRSL